MKMFVFFEDFQNYLVCRLRVIVDSVMVQQSFPSLMFEAFNKWKENTLNNTYFFRRLLCHLGYWPPTLPDDKNASLLNTIISRFIFWFAVAATTIVFPFNTYMTHGVNVLDCIQAAASTFIAAMLAVCAGRLMFQSDRIENAMTALDKMADTAGRHLVSPKVILARTTTIDTLILLYYVVIACFTLPFVSVGVPIHSMIIRDFVIKSWYPYDFKKSPAFELTVLTWMLVAILGLLMVVTFNCHLMSLLSEAIKNLQVLNFNLLHMVLPEYNNRQLFRKARRLQCAKHFVQIKHKDRVAALHEVGSTPTVTTQELATNIRNMAGKKEVTLRISNDNENHDRKGNEDKVEENHVKEIDSRLREGFRICLKHHDTISSFVKRIHDAYDIFLIIQLSCSIFPVILGSLYVTAATEFELRMLLMVFFIIACLFDQAIFCWLADKVAEESRLTSDAVFGCDWFGQSEGFKKDMRIVICRCHKPIIIKMAKFVPLTLETFYSVIKLMASYYMSLLAVLREFSR